MKTARVYFKDNMYRISPSTRTSKGARRASNFVIFLNHPVSLKEIGIKILEVLNYPTVVIPHPTTKSEMDALNKEWYSAMKIKSWKSFAKDTKDLALVLHENKVEIIPTKNEQPKGSFAHLMEKSRFCPTDDPEELGRAIVDAFNDCE